MLKWFLKICRLWQETRRKGILGEEKHKQKKDRLMCLRDIGSSNSQSTGKVKGDRSGKASFTIFQRAWKLEQKVILSLLFRRESSEIFLTGGWYKLWLSAHETLSVFRAWEERKIDTNSKLSCNYNKAICPVPWYPLYEMLLAGLEYLYHAQ